MALVYIGILIVLFLPLLAKPPTWAPTFLRRAYAITHGYFWLPCDVCGRWSGGQEWRGGGYVTEDWREMHNFFFVNETPVRGWMQRSRGVCPWCEPAARAIEARGEKPTIELIRAERGEGR